MQKRIRPTCLWKWRMGNMKETGKITSRMVLEILFINQEIFIVVLG